MRLLLCSAVSSRTNESGPVRLVGGDGAGDGQGGAERREQSGVEHGELRFALGLEKADAASVAQGSGGQDGGGSEGGATGLTRDATRGAHVIGRKAGPRRRVQGICAA